MPTRKLQVEILGDSSSLQRAFAQSSKAGAGFGSSLAKIGKIAAVGLAVGVGAAAYAATKFAKAAIEAEKSQTRLANAFDHVKTSAAEQGRAMEAVNEVMNQSGLDDEDLKDSLARLVTVTGDVTKAQKDMAVAADVARARGIDLAAATKIVEKAELGNVGALKRIGIEVPKVTAATDALKESHVKATQAQKDAAAAADVVATKQAAIAALQAKFGGAAEKFGQTAAGSMERFQVAAHNVEEELGAALLPTLAKVAGGLATFINKFNEAEGASAKFRVVMDGIKTVATGAFEALRAGFNAINWGQVWTVVSTKAKEGLSKAFSAIVSFVQGINWNEVGAVVGRALVGALNKLDTFLRSVDWARVTKVMIEGFKKVVVAFGTFLAGVDWGAVIGKMFHLLVAVIEAQATILLTIAKVLGVAIIKGIVAGLEGVANAVTRKLDAVRDAIVNAAGNAYGNALGVGKAIVRGILNGIVGLPGALADKLGGYITSAIHKAGSILHGSGEFEITRTLVGKPLAEGVIGGFASHMAGAGSRIATSVSGAIAAMVGEVKKLQGQLDAINARRESEDRASAVRDAMTAVAEARKKGEGVAAAEQALARAREDIVTAGISKRIALESAGLEKLTAAIDAKKAVVAEAFSKLGDFASRAFGAQTQKMLDKVAAKFDRLIAKAQAMGDALTPAEQALQNMDKAEGERQRNQALSDAQAGGDPEAIRQAQLAIERAHLEDQAAVERAARDKATQVRVTALEAAKQQELQNLTERRNQLGQQLDEQVALLQAKLALHPEKYAANQKAIVTLLNKFGVDYKTAGVNLGKAFAHGLDEAQDEVAKSAKALARVVQSYLKTGSPTEKGPMSDLNTWWRSLPSTLAAGVNMAPVAGVASDIAAGPSGGGMGGMGGSTTIQIMLDRRVISEIVRNDLIAVGRRNGSALGGLA